MRILFIVTNVPNLVRVRPYNLIRCLGELGHEVTVLTLWSTPAEREDARRLAGLCRQVVALPLPRRRSLWNCLLALPGRRPLQAVYCWQPALARELSRLTRAGDAFDAIHVEHLRGAAYGLHYRQTDGRLPVVWDSVDSISHLFRQAAGQSRSQFGRWVGRLELGRTERYEAWLARQFNHLLVTSPIDRQAFLDLLAGQNDHAPITVLPNGVALDYFRPDAGVEREEESLVVTGKMSYHANVSMVLHLVEEIMPRIWQSRPAVRLTIVGKDPPPAITALAHDQRVTVTGTVPDIRPYLQRAAVAVSPTVYSAGIQNKALEAMACATPVVASPGAISALNVIPEQELLTAAGPAAFAQAVLTLLAQPDYRRRLGEAGRRYVEQHHDWRQIAGRLAAIYRDAQACQAPPGD